MSETLRKDRIDALGGSLLIGFSVVLGLNQALVKIVNDGLAPVFQSGLRSACALPLVLGFAVIMRRRLSVTDTELRRMVSYKTARTAARVSLEGVDRSGTRFTTGSFPTRSFIAYFPETNTSTYVYSPQK